MGTSWTTVNRQPVNASKAGSKSSILPQGRLAWHEARWGIFFISPWVLGFLIFQLGPMVASLYYSFTEYNILKPPQWVGLENYQAMISTDPRFWDSLRVTFYYVLLRVPPTLIGALFCAIMLNQAIRGRVFFRTLFFIPSITPAVAAILVWTWVLDPNYGLVNFWLRSLGITGPAWLGDPKWAVPSLVLLGVWGSIGGTSAIIFLSALQEIPVSYYEAAKVDGANWFHLQRYITLPLLTPSIFFVLILTIIGTFQTFTAAYVGTRGGPAYATYFFVLHLYQQAFQSLQMGYASALAWVLVVILLAFTWLQMKSSERWVHYGS